MPVTKEIISQCKKDNEKAREIIFNKYSPVLLSICIRYLKDRVKAEDVMQEAFLNAFTKLESYKGEVAFGAWLKRIVINMSLTQIKKNSRFEEVKFEVLENTLEDEDSMAGNDIIDYSMIKAKEILKTMEELKDNYRVALTLSLIEGYDNEEIALIMNISNENCRTTISRAKNKLRRLLQHDTLVN